MCHEYISGSECLKNNVQYTSMGLCPQTIHVETVPLAHIKSSLSNLGPYWPFHNERWGWINAGNVGPTFVAPPLHAVSWKAGDP
jgi:hypothetical protein